MTLLQRVERARQAQIAVQAEAEAAQAATSAPSADPTPAAGPDERAAESPAASTAVAVVEPPAPRATPVRTPARNELTRDIAARVQVEFSREFGARIDLEPAALRARIEGIVDRVRAELGVAITRDERLLLVDGLLQEIVGLGPLEPLLADDVDHRDHGQRPEPDLHRARAARSSASTCASPTTSTCCGSSSGSSPRSAAGSTSRSPRVDARLPDGSRVNAIIPPLSLDGPGHHDPQVLRHGRITVEDLVGFGTATGRDVRLHARRASRRRLNIVISGGTGSGKTTMLNVLSSLHPRATSGSSRSRTRPSCSSASSTSSRSRRGRRTSRARGEITIRDLAAQRAAHAPRPDHRRRVPRRRGARHAPGHEHRPRRLADDRPRQQPARTCSAASRRWS